MSNKGQTSVEITVILGIMLLVLVIFLVANTNTSAIFQSKFSKDQVQNSLDSVASAAEFVYAQGSGAKKEVLITVPNSVQSASVGNRTLTFNLFPTGDFESSVPVYKIVDFTISGSLPTSSGNYIIQVKSLGGYVNVSYS